MPTSGFPQETAHVSVFDFGSGRPPHQEASLSQPRVLDSLQARPRRWNGRDSCFVARASPKHFQPSGPTSSPDWQLNAHRFGMALDDGYTISFKLPASTVTPHIHISQK